MKFPNYQIMKSSLYGIAAIVTMGSLSSSVFYGILISKMQEIAAIVFNYLTGEFNQQTYREGLNFKLPYVTQSIIYNTRTKYIEETSSTANRDLQKIDFTIRVLYKPDAQRLVELTRSLGKRYEEKILSPLIQEVSKTIIAQYTAQQLLSQREQVSSDIKVALNERLGNFNVLIDEVSITHTSFSREYEKAIEDKQIAQQTAERMKYKVMKAKQIKKSNIISAEADCRSIELIGQAVKENPAYLSMQKIEAAQEIATILKNSKNKILLDSNLLLLNTALTKQLKRL